MDDLSPGVNGAGRGAWRGRDPGRRQLAIAPNIELPLVEGIEAETIPRADEAGRRRTLDALFISTTFPRAQSYHQSNTTPRRSSRRHDTRVSFVSPVSGGVGGR